MNTKSARDRAEFMKAFLTMGMAIERKKPNDETIKLYFHLLADYDLEDVLKALMQTAVSCRFFPKPVEIIEHISGSQDEKALLAWERLGDAKKQFHPDVVCDMSFVESGIQRAVAAMGGWREVHFWPQKYLGFKKKEFVELYKAYSKAPVQNFIEHKNGQSVKQLAASVGKPVPSLGRTSGQTSRRKALSSGRSKEDQLREFYQMEKKAGNDLFWMEKDMPELYRKFSKEAI